MLAIAILAVLIYQNWGSFETLTIDDIRWEYAAAGFAAVLAALLCTFFRWYLLVWAQDFELSLGDAFRLGFLGYAFNYVLPGAVSGDLVKAGVLAARQKSRRAVAFASVILDRALGLLALFIIGSLVWTIQTDETRHWVFEICALVFTIGAVVGSVGLVVALHTPILQAKWLQKCTHWKFIGGILRDMLGAVAQYNSRARIVWWTLGISIVGHIFMLAAFFCCALAINSAQAIPTLSSHLLFMPAAELTGMIPIVPGGSGLLEGAVAKFYGLAGFDTGKGLRTGGVFRVISITIAALGAKFGLSARRQFKEELAESPPAEAPQPAEATEASLV